MMKESCLNNSVCTHRCVWSDVGLHNNDVPFKDLGGQGGKERIARGEVPLLVRSRHHLDPVFWGLKRCDLKLPHATCLLLTCSSSCQVIKSASIISSSFPVIIVRTSPGVYPLHFLSSPFTWRMPSIILKFLVFLKS